MAEMYGPYYQSSRRAQEAHRRALGQPALSPAAIAAERYGELSAYLSTAQARKESETRMGIAERDIALREEGYESEKKGRTVSGIGQMAAIGATMTSALAGGAGTLLGVGTGAGTGAMIGLPAGPLGAILGAIVGFFAGGGK